MPKLFAILISLTFSFYVNAQVIKKMGFKRLSKENKLSFHLDQVKHKKSIAAVLDISLGVFGVHRLYLGTSPKVPVVYTITLGGGGFLVLTDLGIILFSKDIERYSNKSSVLMWN